MTTEKLTWFGGVALIVTVLLHGACTSSVVVEGGGTAGSGGAGDSASTGNDQGGFGGECAGIFFKRDECPETCEEKRVRCDPLNGPVGEGGRLCPACQDCRDQAPWMCSPGG